MKTNVATLLSAALMHQGVFTHDFTAPKAKTLYGNRDEDMPSPPKINIEDETLEQFRARQAALKKP